MNNIGSQCRTALAGMELGRYGIDIAALSTTCFVEIGEIKEVCASYTLFWSGRKIEERCEVEEALPLNQTLMDCQMALMMA